MNILKKLLTKSDTSPPTAATGNKGTGELGEQVATKFLSLNFVFVYIGGKMFRFISILFLLILMSATCHAMSDAAIAKSFEKYVKTTMTKVIKTYDGVHYTRGNLTAKNGDKMHWLASIHINPTYKYDLEKTNSVLSPHVGVLEVEYIKRFHELKSVTEEIPLSALKNEYIQPQKEKSVVKFVYKNKKWEVLNARWLDENGWRDIAPEIGVQNLECKDLVRENK